MRITSSLMIPAGCMLLVSLFAWGLYLNAEWNAAYQKAYSQTMTLAKSVGTDLDGVFRDYGDILSQLSNRPKIIKMDPQDCDPVISHLASISPEIAAVTVRDIDGGLVCSSLPDAVQMLAPEYRSLLDQAASAKTLNITGLLRPPPLGRWVGIVTYPVRDPDNQVIGVLIVALDLAKLSSRIFEGVKSDAAITIVDRDLNIALRSSELDRWIGKPLPSEVADIYTAGDEGNFTAKDIAGVNRIGSYTRLARSKWIVAVGLPMDAFMRPLIQNIYITSALGGSVLMLAFGLTLWFGRSITKPVKELERAARKYVAASSLVRVEPRGPREIRDVAATFNRMIESITSMLKTQAKNTEALKASEERFRLIAKATSDVLWDWDINTDHVWWSDTVLKYQSDHEKAEAQNGVTASISAANRAEIRERISAALFDGKDISRDKFRFVAPDGSTNIYIGSGFAIRDASGKPVRIIGSITDVTEKAMLEDQVRHAQKMEAIGQLTGGFAHDFNNLLTIILGKSEFLSELMPKGSEEARLASRILEAAERGATLTNHLLAYAHKQPLAPEVISPCDVITGMKGLVDKALLADIELSIECTGSWYIQVDKAQLISAILNLIVNARDAMPSGGLIRVLSEDMVLETAHGPECPAGEYVQITVSDNGTGMPPSVAKRVFEPFFTTKDVGRGSGLGLSMVQGFVRQSSGFVDISSEVGRGTDVRMYFPRSTAPLAGAPDRIEVVRGQGERILVVEDDVRVAEYMVNQLRLAGYRVWHATTGADAIRRFDEVKPIDLLLCDVVLPGGMNGLELSVFLKMGETQLRTLYISGYDKEVLNLDGRLPEGIQLLRKPFHRLDLLSAVRRALA